MPRVSEVIGKQLQGSFPGTVGKSNINSIIPYKVTEEVVFGRALKLVTDGVNGQKWENIKNADLEDDFVAISVRGISQETDFFDQNSNVYAANSDVDGLTLGWISVEVQEAAGSVVPGGQVFIRVAVEDIPAGKFIGGFEGAADGVNTIAIPVSYAVFKTIANSANNVAMIHIKSERV